MSPAGNFESMRAAIQAGANAVYFGVEQLNMRARATMNFTLEDLPAIVEMCRPANVRTYIALNTIIYDHDVSLVKRIVLAAQEAGIDAVIAADLSVIQIASEAGMPVHISTQVNISNIETVRFYARFADVVVLARELSLRQVRHICDAIKRQQIKGPSGRLVEVEVFAHGALCMAVSGKCYISLHTQNASANRGACVQNCRRKYKVTDLEDGHELEIDNEYIMSPKDLCTIGFLDELLDTGITILKLEGRGKGADYVHTVTACYREAIDAMQAGTYSPDKVNGWMERLGKVYNRGFWGGYFLGKELGEWTDAPGSKAGQRKIYIGKGSRYYPRKAVGEFVVESYGLKKGDKVMIIGPSTGVTTTEITSLHVNEEGEKHAAIKGDTCAFPVSVRISPADKLFKLVAADEEEK